MMKMIKKTITIRASSLSQLRREQPSQLRAEPGEVHSGTTSSARDEKNEAKEVADPPALPAPVSAPSVRQRSQPTATTRSIGQPTSIIVVMLTLLRSQGVS